MESKRTLRAYLPVLIVFIVTTILFLLIPGTDSLWGIDKRVMLAGNAILFISTFISFYLFSRSLTDNNVHSFMRKIYAGMFARMMICLIAYIIYIMIVKKGVSKGGIFGCMFLYFVYTFVEISIIMKLSRKDKYAKDRSAA